MGSAIRIPGRLPCLLRGHSYRSALDPTYGSSVPAYDSLNRPTGVTLQDGTNTKQTYYGANVTTVSGVTTQGCSSTTYGVGYPTVSLDEALRQILVLSYVALTTSQRPSRRIALRSSTGGRELLNRYNTTRKPAEW